MHVLGEHAGVSPGKETNAYCQIGERSHIPGSCCTSSWDTRMARTTTDRRDVEDLVVEVDCPWCGLVKVDDRGARVCRVGRRGGGLCQFVCPLCGRLATKSVSLLEVKTLLVAGAHLLAHAPLELLEPKKGDALSWDDVLDFRLAFELG